MMTGEDFFYVGLVSIFCALYSIVCLRYPYVIWRFTARLESQNVDGPSDTYLFGAKVDGILALLAIPALWLFVLYNHWQ